MAVIGWIGLGHMGGPMASHLVEAGHDVVGYDVDAGMAERAAATGVRVVTDAAAAARDADAVFTSLPRSEHSRAVLIGGEGGRIGLFDVVRPDALVLDTSTVDVATSRACHDAAEARGIRFVDAPVSGGIAGAHAGTLTFMLGGEEAATGEAAGLVGPMAGHAFVVGGPTAGIAAKLANNLMLFITLQASSEGARLAEALGLDPTIFHDIATVSSGDSWPLRTWYPVPGVVPTSPANRNFDATFTTRLAEKDLSYALEAGDAAGLDLAAGRLAMERFTRLIDEGYGDLDCSLVVKYVGRDGRTPGFDPEA
ncbi:3-hydroxyisobutyrate dehydrogenase [Agromyces luteolus]|uniref:NAD-binding protein n=1 Tax=Agromyces luteolus TaxID=88373 RepID=A0A7C9LF29_9MICO|nr:NAD(P)-binding domain-containing protein [Agromyces luteolus]MUN05815.1 NAD-binding protein [Agromyces luteolus]GLK26364.1 3-hydroxyisobutyrate dehydrogenase [Agromyces luteolus]